jgi:hypothetical protein
MADRWAVQRGFKVEEGLKTDALPRALSDAKSKETGEQESVNWATYYSTLEYWANIVESGELVQGPIGLPTEVETQIRAVAYANARLRFGPFGLFSELDKVWAEYWPEARVLGGKIAAIVETIGIDNRQQCDKSMISLVEYLGLPPQLMVVKRPSTGEVVWPSK